MAAVDYFLKIQGLDGESTSAPFPGGIDVESFSWGATNPSTIGSGSGGAGSGKVSLSEFSFVKRIDQSSPGLLLACASGRHIPAVQFVSRRTPNFLYLEITLTDVLVSSFKEAGTQGELPLEEVTLNFAKIQFEYVPLLPNGKPGQPVRASVDINGRF